MADLCIVDSIKDVDIVAEEDSNIEIDEDKKVSEEIAIINEKTEGEFEESVSALQKIGYESVYVTFQRTAILLNNDDISETFTMLMKKRG